MNKENFKQFNNDTIKNKEQKENYNFNATHSENCDCGHDCDDHCDCGCNDNKTQKVKSGCTCGCENDNNSKQKKSKGGHNCNCADEANAQIEQLTKERDGYLDMARRSMAEFANFKKRNEEAIAVAMEAGAIKTISQVLPSMDAFDKALAMVSDEKTKEGLNLIKQNFERIFESLNITEIDALNKPFDPIYHEAIATVPTDDNSKKDMVAEVYQKGFMYKDKVFRHSVVKVSK